MQNNECLFKLVFFKIAIQCLKLFDMKNSLLLIFMALLSCITSAQKVFKAKLDFGYFQKTPKYIVTSHIWGDSNNVIITPDEKGRFEYKIPYSYVNLKITFPDNPNLKDLYVYWDEYYYPYNVIKIRIVYPKRKTVKSNNSLHANYDDRKRMVLSSEQFIYKKTRYTKDSISTLDSLANYILYPKFRHLKNRKDSLNAYQKKKSSRTIGSYQSFETLNKKTIRYRLYPRWQYKDTKKLLDKLESNSSINFQEHFQQEDSLSIKPTFEWSGSWTNGWKLNFNSTKFLFFTKRRYFQLMDNLFPRRRALIH